MPGVDFAKMKDMDGSKRALEQKGREIELLNRELTKAKAAATAGDQAKRDFLAMIGHEIRSPLNGVFVMCELLLETELTEEQKRYAGLIYHNANALLSMFNDILDFTQLGQEGLNQEETPFALRESIRDILALFHQEIAGKGVELYFAVDEQIPDLLYGDIRRLRKVLMHLLANAVKFTDQGRIYLITGSTPAESGRIKLSFTIRDTGIGIPKDKMFRLFEPFTQFDSAMTRRYGGLGMGLAVCQKLVNQLGGELQTKPLEENGTVFTFSVTLWSRAPGVTESL
ncbi:MAG: hypothetical protein KZY74_14500 [Paenibacillaceae bacterium]|nr:hypothetical protein [Paenibacillaceae bacterium]